MHQNLAALIRETRERQDLSQGELGQLLGISRSALNQIENGERNVSATELLALAHLFGEWLEVGVETLINDVCDQLTARIRSLLRSKTYKGAAFAKRTWLLERLSYLDHG